MERRVQALIQAYSGSQAASALHTKLEELENKPGPVFEGEVCCVGVFYGCGCVGDEGDAQQHHPHHPPTHSNITHTIPPTHSNITPQCGTRRGPSLCAPCWIHSATYLYFGCDWECTSCCALPCMWGGGWWVVNGEWWECQPLQNTHIYVHTTLHTHSCTQHYTCTPANNTPHTQKITNTHRGLIFLNLNMGWQDVYARASLLFFVVAFLTFMSIAGYVSFTERVKV